MAAPPAAPRRAAAADTSPILEAERLRAVRRTALLDTPPEEEFDRLTRLAADVLRAPVALVTLLDGERQFFKSHVGLPEPLASRRQTPLSRALTHEVATGQPLVVADSRTDPLLNGNAAIQELGVIAYAGVPLVTADGHALGSLCVADREPRAWSADDVRILSALATAAVKEIEARVLARATAALAAVLDQLADGVVVADVAGLLVLVNAAAARLHGAATAGDPVKSYSDACAPLTLDGPPHLPTDLPLVETAQTGQPILHARWRIRRPDGTERFAEGSASPVTLADGPYGSVMVVRDITDQHALDRQKDDFLSSISHDLKNPLTLIRGTMQMLQKHHAQAGEVSVEHMAAACDAVQRAVAKMVRQLDAVLDVSRVRMGQPVELDLQTTDLVALAVEVIADFDAAGLAGAARPIRLGPSAESLVGLWDTTRLQRTLANLLTNAVKYSPAGGEITVAVRRAASLPVERPTGPDSPTGPTGPDGPASPQPDSLAWAELSVADHGIGIPADDLPHVFERFRRAGNAPRVASGTGIGLADVLQTVQWHGGTVRVESRVGAGSTFTIRLPLPSSLPTDQPSGRGGVLALATNP
ncbi:MAG TPA: ATP-binding protein [Chloroflexota bacterium]|nr:ATP-binding protein [Chloroflexota bacterium]